MAEKYEAIFDRYKTYIETNSQYGTKVVKYNKKSSTYFPLISFVQSDDVEQARTNKGIDRYDKCYFTINIYTKAKKIDNQMVAPEVIDSELEKLTLSFFDRLNFRRTLDTPTPNIDDDVFRRTMRYQCEVGNRLNIIRR